MVKMDLTSLLTSAGLNIGVAFSLFMLYSVLRKQPGNLHVYYARKADTQKTTCSGPFARFVPTPSWLLKAWETPDEEILAVGGMDAVVFVRMISFSFRMFLFAAIICTVFVLPVNYYGKDMVHVGLLSETLDIFTIANVREGSRWLWVHCVALNLISCVACVLLYYEYKHIAKMRVAHITESPPNPSHFTVLVRAIPWSSEESYSDSVKRFFIKYYPSSYLTHQMVYENGTIQELMNDAERAYKMFKNIAIEGNCKPRFIPRHLCGTNPDSFKFLSKEEENIKGSIRLDDMDCSTREKESSAAFVSFKTRHAAIIVADVLQSANPLSWVTEQAPEPYDIIWSNVCIPYRLLWIRQLGVYVAFILFMSVYMLPVVFVQSLVHIDVLSSTFPSLYGFLHRPFIHQVVQGYLPSVILAAFQYTVPPTMMLFSKLEGSVSRSGRKRSTCVKVLLFTIWNVFLAHVLASSFVESLSLLTSVKDVSQKFANSVPDQAGLFIPYVMTTGWAGLGAEIMQPYPLLCNFIRKVVLKKKGDPPNFTQSFPYHTEVPKVLMFGFLGFLCSILIPLILPFLLIYLVLAYLVYRNQFLNVYVTKYESGGKAWTLAHNATISSLVMAQIIAVCVFVSKNSLVTAGFICPSIIGTLVFNEYCRRRFRPTFKRMAAQVLMEMDRQDEQSGSMEEIHELLDTAYSQFWLTSHEMSCDAAEDTIHHKGQDSIRGPEASKQGEKLVK